MRLDDLRPTENVDDRRGRGGFGGPRLAMGGGGLGLVAILVISWLAGVDPMQFLAGGGPDAGYGPAQMQNSGAPRADDDEYRFARQIVGSAEDVWSPILRGEGASFSPATLTTYDRTTPTSCGTGSSSAGPFYCPADGRIYLDLSFFDELRDRFGAGVSAHPQAAAPDLLGDCGLLVNTTSVGMAGKGEGGSPADPARLPAHAVVTDIVYVPLQTPLLTAASARGLKTVDGLGMLLHQAAPGFERWFGRKPEVTPELRRLIVADIEGH